jgi:hypothetical protein
MNQKPDQQYPGNPGPPPSVAPTEPGFEDLTPEQRAAAIKGLTDVAKRTEDLAVKLSELVAVVAKAIARRERMLAVEKAYRELEEQDVQAAREFADSQLGWPEDRGRWHVPFRRKTS